MSRSNYWCFTINNYGPNEVSSLSFAVPSKAATYLIYGFEVGDYGTRHIQGYIEFSRRLRFAQVVAFLGGRAHVERRLGTADQAAKYCKKDAVFCEAGEISVSKQGNRSDLDALHTSLLEKRPLEDISNDHFGSFLKYQRGIAAYRFANAPKRTWETLVIVYWGRTGAGKSRAVHDNATDLYCHPGGQWFDGYEGQKQVLFDDFGGSEFKLQYLLKLLDRYPMQVPIKGGFVQWAPKEVYITSNLDPDDWFRNANAEHVRAMFRRFTNVVHFE